MPSGETHDRITLWSLPVVTGIAFIHTRSGNLTLVVAGGFLFSGLMFGPDLDIYSRQFIRWGWLRWIWLPYQKSLHHRSFLSHGPLIGTALRVVYLATWIGVFGSMGVAGMQMVWGVQWNWEAAGQTVARSLERHYTECIALLLGLELGAMSHSLSDWGGSTYKRFKTRGFSALLPQVGKSKKRKPQVVRYKKPRTPSTSRIRGRSKAARGKRKSKA